MIYLGDKAVGIAVLKELDGIFEVVHRFTPTENESRHTMPNFGPGFYVFLEDPILTRDRYINDNYSTNSLVMGGGMIYNNTTGSRARAHITLTMIANGYDSWGSYFTCDENSITIGIAASNQAFSFLKDHNYIVMKTVDN